MASNPSQRILDNEGLKARFPVRPGYGTIGESFNAVANSYEIKTMPDIPLIHYDVEITARNGRPVPKNVYKVLVVHVMTTRPDVFTRRGVHDGFRNLWLTFDIGSNVQLGASLPQQHQQGAEQQQQQVLPYSVKLTRVATVNVRALSQVILTGQQSADPNERLRNFRNMATTVMVLNSAFQMVGRDRFRDNANRKSTVYHQPRRELDSGVKYLELWVGYFQSVRPSIGRLTVNIDTTHGLMYRSGRLIDLVLQYLNIPDARGLTANRIRSIRKLQVFLKGVVVTVSRNQTNQTGPKRILKVIEEGARQHRFDDGNGNHISVAAYFRERYGTTITFPDIICVAVGKSDVVVPLECCTVVPGQLYKGNIPPEATSKAVRVGTVKPGPRLDGIKQAYHDLRYGQSDFIRGMGMTVDDHPLPIRGLVKPRPPIYFGHDHSVQISPNSSFTLPGKRFFTPAFIDNWVILYYMEPSEHPDAGSGPVRDFARALADRMAQLGITGRSSPGFPPPIIRPVVQGSNVVAHMQSIAQTLSGKRISLIVGIMPNPSDVDQVGLKRFGDIISGIATQIVRKDKMRRGAADDYLHNLICKINLKLGGINWVLQPQRFPWFLPETKTLKYAMIIGADVSHPPPNNTTSPSICGVVVSIHKTLMQYVARSSVQMGGRRVETIVGLADLLQPIFTEERNHKGDMPSNLSPQARTAWLKRAWPEIIIYYRDGVGETQLAEVTEAERAAILDAFTRAQAARGEMDAPKPKITFIVVSKRHHQRFFPQDRQFKDRNENCLPGSTFDQGIAHPVLFDFYLQSQAPILGTGRPAHYVVTHNENTFTSDTLQQLSYDLCYTYQRATRSVSIPAPTYYADLVCRRSKFMFPPGYEMSEQGSMLSGQDSDLLQQHQSKYGPMHPNLMNKMYFV